MVEALEPFSIYEASPVEQRAHEIALAFGLRYVVREERREGGLGGMTSSAAAQAGIPAIIAEAGGCGQLEESAVGMLVEGVRNVLRHLEMLPEPPRPPRPDMRTVGSFVWLRCERGGWWDTAVAAGDELVEGQLLGRVRNLWGDVLEEIHSPRDGVVLFLQKEVQNSPLTA